jgi:hypothetical protein
MPPAGNDVVVIARAASGSSIVRVKDSEEVCGLALESLTLTTNDAVPATVGIPARFPVDEVRAIPAGSVPAVMLHV